jgi:peptide/nickel transport system substrate-binding protein
MRLLVDRPQLIDSGLDGYGVAAFDVFSPYDPDFDHALHREQDIPQAKFLLKRRARLVVVRSSTLGASLRLGANGGRPAHGY